MHKLNPENLFNIFNASDETVYKEHGLDAIMQNPYVLMGMVVRGVENFYLIDGMYSRRYGQDYEKYRETIRVKFFDRLYGYLLSIDFTKFENIYMITQDYDKIGVFSALDHLLFFYQDLEHYEKCALIKKFRDLLESTTQMSTYDYNVESLLNEMSMSGSYTY